MFFGQTKTCLFLGWPNPSRPNQPKRDMFWFGRQSILLLFIRYGFTLLFYPLFYPAQILFFLGTSKVFGNDAKPNMIGKVLQKMLTDSHLIHHKCSLMCNITLLHKHSMESKLYYKKRNSISKLQFNNR